jgi:uncharacterized protein (TIGR02145 family)
MENIMKKQSEKSSLWIFRGLLLAVLGGFGTAAFAQGVEVCEGTAYTIASTVDASGASTYQWLENGQIISGVSDATYEVPSTKEAGLYTYIRQAKSADCPDWQSSNEFAVTVFACSFTAGAETGATATFVDLRDGKSYKTVVMPDGKTWFAQNLNYTKDLTYNVYSYEANGKQFTSTANGVPAVGSYWCPPLYWSNGAALAALVSSGNQSACDTYGALYTWETSMMVDGKYSDEAKSSSAWDESWVSGSYLASGISSGTEASTNKNNARAGRGICPMSWHIPTDYEWAFLLDKVEGDGNGSLFKDQTAIGWIGSNDATTGAGAKMKSAATFSNSETDPGTGAWLDDARRGNNSTGFGVVPAGLRRNDGVQINTRGDCVYYWSSSVSSSSNAWRRYFAYSVAQVFRGNSSRSYGFSVRCVKD